MRWLALFVLASSLFFGFTVYASEGIISPLADTPLVQPGVVQPTVITISAPSILGVQSSLSNAVTQFFSVPPTPISTPSVSPTPTPIIRATKKSQMTIALLGDSMIDTLGPDGGSLAGRLNKIYPNTTFTIYNHGVGGQNIDTGLLHLTSGYSYLGAIRPSVLSQSPDIIVVESYGYNPYPYDTGALVTHWLRMASIMDTIKQTLPNTKIVIAATIAPNWNVFGDGAPFINMSPEGKKQKVATIDSYIESTISFAQGEHYPLADAYHPSRGSDGNGMIQYINGGDHIHYSDAGRALMAGAIANVVVSNRLLE